MLENLPHLHGVLSLPVTVFKADGAIDWVQTKQGIEFAIQCGATAICYACGIGEYQTLSESERKKALEVAVDTVNGRLPVVGCGSGASTELAIAYHKHARENGAAACMTTPPLMGPRGNAQDVYDHYTRLADTVDIPIMLHNMPPPRSWAIPPELSIRMLNEIENVNYIKEEAIDPLTSISRIRAANPKYLKSLLSSDGGIREVDDALRGADGTIIGPEAVDCHVHTWDAIERGEWDLAWQYHRQYLPLTHFIEMQRNIVGCKQVLRRRGVIDSTVCRIVGFGPFGEYEHQMCDILVKQVSPIFRIPLPE